MLVLQMALRPDVMRRVQVELDAVVGKDRMPTFQDQDRLPYLSAVIKEVIRWHTTILLAMPHQCTKVSHESNHTLHVGLTSSKDEWYRGYLIPKGCIVLPNVW